MMFMGLLLSFGAAYRQKTVHDYPSLDGIGDTELEKLENSIQARIGN
jgi:hypothetical protein